MVGGSATWPARGCRSPLTEPLCHADDHRCRPPDGFDRNETDRTVETHGADILIVDTEAHARVPVEQNLEEPAPDALPSPALLNCHSDFGNLIAHVAVTGICGGHPANPGRTNAFTALVDADLRVVAVAVADAEVRQVVGDVWVSQDRARKRGLTLAYMQRLVEHLPKEGNIFGHPGPNVDRTHGCTVVGCEADQPRTSGGV